MKRIIFWFLYIIYILSIIVVVDYFFYFLYRKSVHKDPGINYIVKIKNIDEDTFSRLGERVSIGKASSFVNFEEEKPDGIIRIGCFGCSFTYGAEVGYSHDYPSLLQDIFIKNGHKNIEVINFGGENYSFFQAFIMWQYIGRKYDLDYLLIGPLSPGEVDRDNTFGRSPYTIQARYILKNGGVELVDPIGRTRNEKVKHYLRFIPHLTYLRFDSHPPAFLACLIPKGLKLKRNPFYYKGDIKEEIFKIYKILLSEMADEEPQVIVGHYYSDVVSMVKKLNKDNIWAYFAPRPHWFPYLALGGHLSPCGNQLLAQRMFDILNHNAESNLSLIKTKDIEYNLPQKVKLEKIDLFNYDDIKVTIGNSEIGSFVDTDLARMDRNCSSVFSKSDDYSIIKKLNTISLVALKNKNTSILDAPFLALDFELKDKMPLTMKIKTKYGENDIVLGLVHLLNLNLNIGQVEFNSESIKSEEAPQNDYRLGFFEEDRFFNNFQKEKEFTIFLDNKEVLFAIKKSKENTFKLLPCKGSFKRIRSYGDVFIDIEKLNNEGIIYLVLRTGKEKIGIPFAKWYKFN